MAKKAAGKRAKQADLPTMEDRAIKGLHYAAEEYADIRDRRMALNDEEVVLRQKVLDIMHLHNKTRYAFNGLEVEVVPPDGEKVKVRIKKQKASDDGEAAAE